jgi:photosystem II stability/assembly factor-like uncharacterized protein
MDLVMNKLNVSYLQRIFFAGAMLFSSPAFSQWYKLAEFPTLVGVVHFVDTVSPPQKGFVGTMYGSGGVWFTTDGGVNWQQSSPLTIPESIASFSFKDSLNGWLSRGYYNITKFGAYVTHDAGITWSPVTTLPLEEGTCIYYHKPTKLLFFSSFDYGLQISSDEGLTWTTGISENIVGIAFSNDSIGIATPTYDYGPPPAFYPFYRTTDGGFTWLRTSFLDACWRPLAIKGTSTFFCTGFTPDIFRSDDGGASWNKISSVYNNSQIVGSLDRMYVQGGGQPFGIMTSTDEGLTWKTICGPWRQRSPDEFFVRDKYVYATDFYTKPYFPYDQPGRLWVNTTGNSSGVRVPLSFDSPSRDLGVSAGSINDLIISLPDTLPTLPVVLDSVWIILRYNTDLLTKMQINPSSDWTLLKSSEDSGTLRMQFKRIGSVSPNGKEIARVSFQANIAKEIETDIIVDSVFYNQGEIVNCSVIPEEQVHVEVNDLCGDSTIRNFLRYGEIIAFTIKPNPVKDKLAIEMNLPEDGQVQLEVYDELGKRVMRREVTFAKGRQQVTITTAGLPEGMYSVRMGNVSGRFVKVK